jgi:hypothetical protein
VHIALLEMLDERLERRSGGVTALISRDAGGCQARSVIAHRMLEVPVDSTDGMASIAGDAMTNAANSPELLNV